ncbi:MAG: hypothetical protein DHS20C15_04100 [Planctomycetota bacterium]|nr:MAG: hypothetical protein DHS20C15_04100 [Planctomycetota bacterium]
MLFERPVARVAVGDPDRLGWNLLDDREVLLLGKETGRTSVHVWFVDGSVQSLDISVQPDLSLLERALSDLHLSITAEVAPDREALVLRGVVPDLATSRAAEGAAAAWLGATRVSLPVFGAPSIDSPLGAVQVDPTRPSARTGVINLIRVTELPLRVDGRVRAALSSEAAFSEVHIERVMAGELPDDARDLFLLRGEVRNQVQLSRLIHLTARIVTDERGDLDVNVVSDESGALVNRNGATQADRGFAQSGGAGSSSLLGSSGNTSLRNRLESNIARATVLSAAGGRLLSFVEVSELPQVRVDVQLYEVNVSDLRSRESELALLWGDIPQGSLQPAAAAGTVQGAAAGRVGATSPADIQNAVSFLEDGFRNQLQIVGDNAALDATFQILETEGIARSMARPSLTVLSGERALFQVGGEVPIPQSFATNDVAQGVFNSVVFREFGIQLDVRPLVGEDGRLTLDLAPRVATPSPELTTLVRETTGTDQLTTGFETRSLRTSARLRDGQVLVVGGLLSRDSEWSESRTPWLADIPVLGEFFRRRSDSRDELELVLVVHPTVLHEPRTDALLWDFGDPSELLRGLLDDLRGDQHHEQEDRPQSNGTRD